MNRIEIKQEAREKIKGNIWNIIWPMIIIGALTSVIGSLFGGTVNINVVNGTSNISTKSAIGSGLSAIISGFLTAGYIKYLLTFVRTGKFNRNEIIDTIKEKWVNILIAELLAGIIVGVGFMLLVVPGIIIGLAFTFVIYLVVDTNIAGNDALGESYKMMKGYKWDYFVFELSFIGWFILGLFTCGILYIWLIPYMMVTVTLTYESLKKVTK